MSTNVSPSQPVLHMFASSHFNEKARWALDWKGVAHRRRAYLPGPHALPIRRRTGQTATPVLELGGGFVAGSAQIVARLERDFPDRPLLPADVAERERALEIERRFDAEVGPAVRTAFFSVTIDEPDFVVATFGRDHSTRARAAYRLAYPLLRPVLARAHDLHDPALVARAFERSEQALEFVAKEAGPGGHLVGNDFSLADLACAALLAPLLRLEHPDMRRPEPIPPGVERFLARFADHPGAGWVRTCYARHRPAPCAV